MLRLFVLNEVSIRGVHRFLRRGLACSLGLRMYVILETISPAKKLPNTFCWRNVTNDSMAVHTDKQKKNKRALGLQ